MNTTKFKIILFIAKLFRKKYEIEFDYGFGDGNELVFDETMNDWGRGGKDKKMLNWSRRKDVIWHGQNYIDHIKIKYSNWAKTPEEIKYSLT